MDSVQETPAKRRKIDTGEVSQGYDSQDDSGDNLFEAYETVDTVPVARNTMLQQSSYVTQPTQIIRKSTQLESPDRKPSVVQIVGSSPARASIVGTPTPRTNAPPGHLANMMAPAGTNYRQPLGVSRAPAAPAIKTAAIVDISDDDLPTYQGSSSEEDYPSSRRADIKPSTFIQNVQKSSGLQVARSSADRFRDITTSSVYQPSEGSSVLQKQGFSALSGSVYDSRNRDEGLTSSKIATTGTRSADVLANAYGGARNRPATQSRQKISPKLQPPKEIDIEDVEDYQLRSKIKRIQMVLPGHSVKECMDALLTKKGNFDDAMEMLASRGMHTPEIDLTHSDDDLTNTQPTTVKKPSAKQQIKAPNQKIQEKWTTTQSFPKSTLPPSPAVAPPKPRRRLVQGRKKESSPIASPLKPSLPRPATPETDASDSGIGTEPEDTELEGKVLGFFNTCSTSDLADIAAISEEVSLVILSQKPFASLNDVRQISGETAPAKGKRKTTRKPIGDKIVDKCLEMWTGYEAVDELVRRCEELGKPVKDEMTKWGVSVFGSASRDGELELADFDAISNTSMRDSGIGTPTSRSVSVDGDNESEIIRPGQKKHGYFPQPTMMGEGVTLKDYQIVGVNWLALLYEKGLSCILADDMGLGKTCQVIAFLAHLLEKGVKGPHLVIVPGSTLENWLREFSQFCPQLSVMPYYAGQKERAEVREQIEENLSSLNVIVTTYGIAKVKEDNKFLRLLKPICCVYDEGHYLRNSKSAGYDAYMRIPAQFRLLLTGTPLQNNLRELASLLGFILPSVFREHSEALEAIFSHKAKTSDGDESHAALLSAQRIARAKSMMTPFVLRRKKHQVLKHLPQKHRRVQYCQLSPCQTEIYEKEKAKALRVISARAAGEKTGNETSNVMMALRKASIHPLLFRRLYDDKTISKMAKACLMEDELSDRNVDLVFEDMTVMTDMELHRFCETYPDTMAPFSLQNDEWMDSGKVKVLCDLLKGYKANGDRVLVFSQFVMVMDILEAVMETLDMQFFRLDGQTKIDERQDMIDQFHNEPEITVFLLSTGAGGAGINLACANKVVIFDSSFNPQQDIQAENRAHRVGQTREVEVVRLVTRGTIEEQIHALGETKLTLDDRVAGVVEEEVDGAKVEKQGLKMVEQMMVGELKKETHDAGKDRGDVSESVVKGEDKPLDA